MSPAHQAASEKTSKIIVVDNGSYSIKAGLASENAPRITLQNCAAVPLAKKYQETSTNLSSTAKPNYIVGDDIYLLHNYFCIRPLEGGLLVDGNLQRLIWDYLFSEEGLRLNKLNASSILITEPYGAPTAVRHVLSQILFEEYGLERLLVSPSQQLVAFAYDNGVCFDVSHYSELKIKPWETTHKVTNKCEYYGIVDDVKYFQNWSLNSSNEKCQLIVDMGHQSTWVIPMLGNMPLDVGVMHSNLGGMHATNLLKNLLAYQTIDLTHNEIMVNMIKNQMCFTSLNYKTDLMTSKSLCSHLNTKFYLPDLTSCTARKSRKLFESISPASVPLYKYEGNENNNFVSILNKVIDSPSNEINNWKEKQQTRSITEFNMANERIRCSELNFYPADYQFEVERLKPSQIHKNSQPPSMECSVQELIENSIFSCPPVVQSSLVKRILLSGGGSASPYFAYRLLMELRRRLPETWPICIYQTLDLANTAWRGGSFWASKDEQYYTYSISRAEFLETH